MENDQAFFLYITAGMMILVPLMCVCHKIYKYQQIREQNQERIWGHEAPIDARPPSTNPAADVSAVDGLDESCGRRVD